ncbi:DYH9 protein, partial [Pomatorhinus ruficollis]|nr:DYH9 protein [Pomatorhinus ruficollis]
QNIHLVAKWLSCLEKKLEQLSEGSHRDFRVFVSAEPAPCPESHIIPQGILENSIKITSEAPTGMHANLHKALDNFSQDTLEMCSQEKEFRSILFALCYFHAVVAERRKFGAQGWNRPYPFSTGDLTISVSVLYNYLEASSKVPYDDLRYLVGEIMYGGHITDDWDRRLCRTYLEEFIKPEMLEGELCLAPGFPLPGSMDYNGYHQYIDDALPPESPYLYGLHPNAEIGFLTQRSERLLRTVLELQPRDSSTAQGALGTQEEMVQALLEEMLEKLTDEFNMAELLAKVEERTPYAVVALQECERMNVLTAEIRRSLTELELGLKVLQPWSACLEHSLGRASCFRANLGEILPMGSLQNSKFKQPLPQLAQEKDFLGEKWICSGTVSPGTHSSAWLLGTVAKHFWPPRIVPQQQQISHKLRHGLLRGFVSFSLQAGTITDARLKELTPAMPVVFIKAIPDDKQDTRGLYPCPLYKTRQRGPTYVWTFNLKTKENPSKWVLAGVALLLQA